MFLDKENLFSNDQAVTSSAASESVIDLGDDSSLVKALNEKGEVEIFVQCTEAFEDGTSLAVVVQSDDDSAFGSATTLFTTAAIAAASLVAGYQFRIGKLPPINERYLRLYYTTVGTFDSNTLTAGLILDKQTN